MANAKEGAETKACLDDDKDADKDAVVLPCQPLATTELRWTIHCLLPLQPDNTSCLFPSHGCGSNISSSTNTSRNILMNYSNGEKI
jgi:hypothetical protein